MPRVSVILSSYNHAAYLRESVNSVLAQTFPDFEILLFDDGSSDDSAAVIRSFDDPRLRPFLFETNGGASERYRQMVAEARGDYVAVQHSDDVWEPDKLEKQVAFLDAHPEYGFSFTWVKFIDEEGQPYAWTADDFYRERFRQPDRAPAEWLRKLFDEGNCFCHPSLLIRRPLYGEHGLFAPPALLQLPDQLMWTKLLAGGEKLHVVPEELVRFRLRRRDAFANVSAETAENQLRLAFEQGALIEAYAAMPPNLFREAFPEYAADIFDEDISFALARAAMAAPAPAFRLFGLRTMARLLGDGTKARVLRERFGYDARCFARDTGQVDCFGLREQMHFARMTLVPDYGDGFRRENGWEKEQYVRHDGSYAVSFDFTAARPLRGLWFLPEQGWAHGARLPEGRLAGAPLAFSAAADQLDEYYFSDDGEVRFYAPCRGEEGALSAALWGDIWYFRQRDVLNVFRDRGRKIADLEAHLTQLYRSLSWRLTGPLRWLRRGLRRES